jgi:FkbM family methyltransferase
MLKTIARHFHAAVARAPRALSRPYLSALSMFCRAALPPAAAQRVRNSVLGAAWPELDFAPRRVIVGGETLIRLVPHLGEFDADALFLRQLTYERPVFDWLSRQAAQRYDLVIEIGANVGVYTVFFDALSRRHGARLQRVVAFEPSPEAFARLLANLRANKTRIVSAYNAAVGLQSGFSTFYEPAGHLTNGSLAPDFARIFSDQVQATQVMAIAAEALEALFAPATRALIKIDVEGYEPELLAALGPLIERHRPDLLVEVLVGAEDRIEAALRTLPFDRFLLTAAGPELRESLVASAEDRDWLLQPAAVAAIVAEPVPTAAAPRP